MAVLPEREGSKCDLAVAIRPGMPVMYQVRHLFVSDIGRERGDSVVDVASIGLQLSMRRQMKVYRRT